MKITRIDVMSLKNVLMQIKVSGVPTKEIISLAKLKVKLDVIVEEIRSTHHKIIESNEIIAPEETEEYNKEVHQKCGGAIQAYNCEAIEVKTQILSLGSIEKIISKMNDESSGDFTLEIPTLLYHFLLIKK